MKQHVLSNSSSMWLAFTCCYNGQLWRLRGSSSHIVRVTSFAKWWDAFFGHQDVLLLDNYILLGATENLLLTRAQGGKTKIRNLTAKWLPSAQFVKKFVYLGASGTNGLSGKSILGLKLGLLLIFPKCCCWFLVFLGGKKRHLRMPAGHTGAMAPCSSSVYSV